VKRRVEREKRGGEKREGLEGVGFREEEKGRVGRV
jgi:hypothetical protein